jgi:hypothetical protein
VSSNKGIQPLADGIGCPGIITDRAKYLAWFGKQGF